MIVLPLLAEGDVVLRSRQVLRVLLCCLPLQGQVVVRAPWLNWILPLFQCLEECRDCVALRGGGGGGGGGGSCGLLESVAPPVVVASVWSVVLILLSGVD